MLFLCNKLFLCSSVSVQCVFTTDEGSFVTVFQPHLALISFSASIVFQLCVPCGRISLMFLSRILNYTSPNVYS